MARTRTVGICEHCGRYGRVFRAVYWLGGRGLVEQTLCEATDDCWLEWTAQQEATLERRLAVSQ